MVRMETQLRNVAGGCTRDPRLKTVVPQVGKGGTSGTFGDAHFAL